MKYCINLHTRRGHPMGTIYGNNKKKADGRGTRTNATIKKIGFKKTLFTY